MASAPTLFTLHPGAADSKAAPRLVAYRFSWAGFWLGPLWLLAQRLWIAATVVAAVAVMLSLAVRSGALSGGAGAIAWLLVAILVGLEGREWLRRALIRRRAPIAGLAYAYDEADAFASAALHLREEDAERAAP